ncbi:MarR family transcriptional regulator [Actinophytocola sediminis]
MVAVQGSLREMTSQLSLLNHRVGARIALKDVDLDCLDLISRNGPISPSALAKHAGLHPATMTGVLDRLERAGWVVRERDQQDRRAVVVSLRRERGGELYRLYGGMRSALDDICADYDQDQLATIAEFLGRVAAAGGQEAEKLGQ